jgi:hypothetical protein
LSIALDTKIRLLNGVPSGAYRKGSLILAEADGMRTIDLDYVVNKGADPLGDLFERLFKSLADRTWEHFEAGGNLPGSGWELNREGLSVQPRKGKSTFIPHGELVAISNVDRHVSIWQKDNAYPAVKIPVGDLNALVLHAMLARKLSANPPPSTEGTGPDGLGRVIFERDIKVSLVIRVLLIPLGLILLSLIFVLFEPADKKNPKDREGEIIVGIVAPAIGLILLGFSFNLFASSFRVQELGVSLTKVRSAKILKYNEMESLSWHVVRHYHNGAYVGTNFRVQIHPIAKKGLSKISFAKTLNGVDEELDNLRDFISQSIRSRMFERLKSGERVRWTGKYIFHADRLRGGKKLAKAGFPDGLPYKEISGQNFKDGYFYLFAKGKKTAVVSIATSEENFYPGYYTLMAILTADSTSANQIQKDEEPDSGEED